MAQPTHRSLFDIGPIQRGIAQLNAVAVGFTDFGKKIGYIDDKGGGYLSRALAAEAVAHIRVAILSDGADVPGYSRKSYQKEYEEKKRQYYPEGVDHYLSGALVKSIRVLNRRYSGGRRGAVAGVAQSGPYSEAPRPAFGNNPAGDMRKIWVYAAAVEYGGGTIDTPRPLMTLAMADFVSRYGPQTSKHFISRLTADAFKDIKKSTKEAAAASASEKQTFKDFGKISGMRAGGISRDPHMALEKSFTPMFIRSLEQAGFSPEQIAYWKLAFDENLDK